MTDTTSTGMVLDGVAASEALDSSGEILRIAGCDISSLPVDGVLNYEHRSDDAPGASPTDILGKILYARKILTADDCENDRQRKYWNELELPFIYFISRLYDGAGHKGAMDLAAQIRDAVANGEKPIMRWSIEGSTLKTDPKNKKILTSSIARCVAATRKPCNKSAVTGIIADPNAPKGWDKNPENVKADERKDLLEEALKRSEKLPHPNFTRLGGHEMQVNPMVDPSQLAKTLTAGGYNAAPSTLTGGSALQREDLGGGTIRRGTLRQKVTQVVKSWTPEKGDFKTYLKHQVPEASEAYVDRFAELVDELQVREDALKVKKTELRLQHLTIELKKAQQGLIAGKVKGTKGLAKPTQPNVIEWQGQQVRPGRGQVQKVENGASNLERVEILSGDENHFYTLPEGKLGGDWSHQDLKKYPRHAVDVMYHPALVQAKAVVDSKVHGHSLNTSPEQQALIHGLDLASGQTKPGMSLNSLKAMWLKHPDGRSVYVKPERYAPHQTTNDARREVIFHNLARDMFGLGEHVPTTALLRHPKTGEEMVAVEGLHDSYHPETALRPNGRYSVNDEDWAHLDRQHKAGVLPKLALMDMILGQTDRSMGNWMQHPNGQTKLIDQGQAFDRGSGNFAAPAYLAAWGEKGASSALDWYDHPIDPQVGAWVQGLDPQKLVGATAGLAPEEQQATVARLLAAQQAFQQRPQTWRSIFYGGDQ